MIVVLLTSLCVNAASPTQATHSRAYWRAVIAEKYLVPACEDVASLAMELASFVSSPDPEIRDSFGYEILANWIHRSGKFSTSELNALHQTFLPYVLKGIGESGTDSVFQRSFALLNLKELAAADLKTPYLTEATFNELFELAIKAISLEQDLRGYVPGKGWGHATAHAADLLRILARNGKLSVPQQSQLVTAIASRARSTSSVFVWGEDARLAAALAAVANRADADLAAFDVWFAALRIEHQRLWQGEFVGAAYVRVRAQANSLAQFAALVARQNNPKFPVKLRDQLHATLTVVN